MNWEALGAISELAGATAVVITLIYLAKQIHESNLAARQAGTQEIQNQNHQFLLSVGTDINLMKLWVRGHKNDPSLTTDEKVQFRALLLQMLLLWERTYSLHQDKRLDPGFWETATLQRHHLINSPGFISFFDDRKSHFRKMFREFIEHEQSNVTMKWEPMGVELPDDYVATRDEN